MSRDDADGGAEPRPVPADSAVDSRTDASSGSEPGPEPAERLSVRSGERPAKPQRPHIPVWQETLILLVVAVLLAVVMKAFFVQAFFIPSESMEPGLVENDRILVQKVSYWGDDSPERGDVVVFEDPGSWLGEAEESGPDDPVTEALAALGLFPSGGHLVKRVVGVAGDTISCCDEQGRLSVNGQAVDESDYARPGEIDKFDCYGPMTGNCDWSTGPVPDGHVFVMGDNRAHSADSTMHMCLEDSVDCSKNPYVGVDLVVGKVFALVWPLSHFGGVGGTDAFDKVPDPEG